MIKRIFCFSMMFFLIISIALYMAGVRSIDLSKGSDWIRAVSAKLSVMEHLTIPDIPTWNFDFSYEPQWYEYIQYNLSLIVNILVAFFNTIIGSINFVAAICKFMVSAIWVLVESPSVYLN